MKIFSERLKTLRLEKGLSQTELANSVGLSQSGIARWESGSQLPNIEIAKRFAIFFGVTIDYLVGLKIKIWNLLRY